MASEEGVSVQTIKLKILYTFDNEQKENHLARWPQSLEVNTCFVDGVNQIGLVELRTCLDCVTTASPELLSRIDIDYAVYALDYSEEDTPLVGQGMLSKHMTAQDEPAAQESEAMITGKITKGVMGLLSKNAQPTLEVKLRLKPVSAFPSQRTRSGSVSSQEGRIPQWLNNNEVTLPPNMQRPMSPMQTSGLETMQRMLSEGGPLRDRNSVAGLDNAIQSRPGSRAGTPSFQPALNAPQRQPSNARRDSFNSGYYSGEDNADDGPARKRAKISKVDWPTKSNLNIERQPDSLRVAASVASSVRLHRPVAVNPALKIQNENLVDEPTRPPTPRPGNKGPTKPRALSRKSQPSALKKQTSQTSASATASDAQNELLDGAISSPEDVRPRSVSSTPANIPSSPPVMLEQQGPMVTSPILPPMLDHHQDSGFMSGNIDDIFGDGQQFNFDDFVMDKGDDQLNGMPFNPHDFVQDEEKKYEAVFDEGNDVEGHQQVSAPRRRPPPKEFALPPPPPRPMSRSQSFTPALRVGMSSPKLAPAPIPRARQILDEQKALGLPAQLPQSEPARPLQRSNTWAPDMSDALMSEAPSIAGDETKQKTKKRVGKAQTKARLETAIAAGEMPPYCDNCGSIETPAWRRAWAKHFTCKWEDVETSLQVGEVCWKEAIDFDDEGTIIKFKGMKCDKRSGDEDDGWVQINLCNPCGLWFNKQKCPRPKEKWQKKPKDRRRRRGGPKPAQAQQKPVTNSRSDAPTPMSDESSPADIDDNDDDDNTGEEEPSDSNEPQLPRMPQNMRANSAEPSSRGLAQIQAKRPLPRQANSSPGPVHHSEVDPVRASLTPKPVRRQLFPTPKKADFQPEPANNSTIANMVHTLPAFVRRSPRLNKTKDIFQVPGVAGAIAISADGKENILPDFMMSDIFDASLFEGPIDNVPLSPSTPKRRSERILAKTPQRQFGTALSPNMQQSPIFRTPKSKQNANSTLQAVFGSAKSITGITGMTPWTQVLEQTMNSNYNFDLGYPSPQGQRKTPKKTPNKHVDFNFPDLPSLNSSSPMTSGNAFNMDFSEMTTDQLQTDAPDVFSTDAAMPSSPPGFYDFINRDDEIAGIDWTTGAEEARPTKESAYPEPDEMAINPPRRSPRSNAK